MRVLCCLDGTNAEKVSKAADVFSASEPPTLGVLYVIDTGPRKDIEHTRERFLRPQGAPLPREKEMHLAEHTAAEDILNEGLRYLPGAERLQRQGRPEDQPYLMCIPEIAREITSCWISAVPWKMS